MTVVEVLLWVLGAALVLTGICAVTIWLERKMPSDEYDERQQISRGRGYRVSFWVSGVYFLFLMAYYIYQVENPEPVIEPYVLIYLGLTLQILTLHIYCILTQSALPLSQKPAVSALSYSFLGISQLISFFEQGRRYEGIPLTGKGSVRLVALVTAATGFLLALTHLLSMLRREKE